jgi:hypothetical protein
MVGASLAPVVLFVYMRPAHTERTLRALAKNELASRGTLIIYSDAPRDTESLAGVEEVRRVVGRVKGFRHVEVRARQQNWGLSRSLTSGVSEVLAEHGTAIVLEDDIEVSPHFLSFMNEGLSTYAEDANVASIHGYVYPVKQDLPETFFLRGGDCWGWATWQRAWNHYQPDSSRLQREIRNRGLTRDFDLGGAFPFSRMLEAQAQGRVDSWAIRWHASAFLDGMYTLYPGRSLVQNIGNDGSGEHSGSGDAYQVTLAEGPIAVQRIPIEESLVARQEFAEFLRSQRPSLTSRIRRRVSRAVGRG